jgi:hypothetical protein
MTSVATFTTTRYRRQPAPADLYDHCAPAPESAPGNIRLGIAGTGHRLTCPTLE